ncbi:MetQ/NlpA family ABC transporter substrate-binding protein [Thermohalobacter berrensis]|uniref:Lipoprotein n=1 Tax=Thermohalobacter berrensis TaxID=99594 RepID=A0A419SZ92_9FIRM|nr:MetQ/NlpA family ABC transporter substrate-binding protein [Thermohalobacter berrensis]RKD30582.1 methionine ABC transporter substrate-binding protein [Thermohalobacter berrensis]
MKRNLLISLVVTLIGGLLLTGCANSKADNNVLKVGATPVPHAKILELVKDDLKKEGIELKIIEFTDYIKPNLALSEGEIDANFFQHVPYMKAFARENDLDIVSIGKVHVEPLGLYSEKVNSVEDLKQGAVIAIPNDPTNCGRALLLLEKNGLIKLKEDAGLEATERDIVKNPKSLKFKPLEAAQLPRVLKDVDGAIINGNYALEAGLVPTKDSLILEDGDSPYANIITVRKGDENNPKLKTLVKVLQSEEVRKFILEKYNGGVVPAF